MLEKTFIYGLQDPITNEIKYIGKANNIKRRLHTHLTKTNLIKCTYKNNWIKSVLNKGLKPVILIIDEVPIEEWKFWEMYWISQFKTWGFKLSNLTEGGDTVLNINKSGIENHNYRHDIDNEEILILINKGLSQKEIAIKLKTNVALINKRMSSFNINFRKNRGKRISMGNTHNYRTDINKEIIMDLISKGNTINKISKILKTDFSTIKNRLNK